MWHNSTEEDPYNDLPPPEQCGWCKDEEGDYTCDWKCPEVIERVTDTINFLTKGCSCKKGCQTNQCGCRKKNNTCGPGCQCQGCKNVATVTEMPCEDRDILTDTESDSSSSCSESLETEIVTDLAEMAYQDATL